jgi:hypothetical protein
MNELLVSMGNLISKDSFYFLWRMALLGGLIYIVCVSLYWIWYEIKTLRAINRGKYQWKRL